MNTTKLILILALAFLATACDNTNDTPLAMGTLEWDRVELIAESSERIVEINVKEGDRVAAGNVVMQLDPQRWQLKQAQAQAARDQAAARLAELKRGPRSELIDEGQARVERVRAQLKNANEQLDRVRILFERNVAGKADLDRITAERDTAQAELHAANADLAALHEGTTLEELQQAEAGLAQAEAALEETRANANKMRITAPRAGVIEALPYETGDQPAPGATVATLLVGEHPYARVYVPEPFKVHVSHGSRAEVHVDGFDQPIAGEVRMIRNEASFTPYFALTEHDRSRLSYLAEITISSDTDLPAGVPVQVHFPDVPQSE